MEKLCYTEEVSPLFFQAMTFFPLLSAAAGTIPASSVKCKIQPLTTSYTTINPFFPDTQTQQNQMKITRFLREGDFFIGDVVMSLSIEQPLQLFSG